MNAKQHPTDLAALLKASDALDVDVRQLLEACRTTSPRGLVCIALARTAFEHSLSQRLLLEAGLTGTALALTRLHYEAVVRTAWTIQCASEEWLGKFLTPIESDVHQESTAPPSLGQMLKNLAISAPQIAVELSRLQTTVKAMHSFVHGGSLAVAHAAMGGHPEANLRSVMLNRNLLQLPLMNAAVMAVNDPVQMGVMRAIRARHVHCFPKSAPAAPSQK